MKFTILFPLALALLGARAPAAETYNTTSLGPEMEPIEQMLVPRKKRIPKEARKTIVAALNELGEGTPALKPVPCPPTPLHAPNPRKVRSPLPLSAPACKVFLDQALPNVNGSNTEQLVITRFGKRLFDFNDGLVKPETARPMWSISKSITATLIGAAVQAGKITLDDPVTKYIPELRKGRQGQQFDGVKIRDLIAMTSGLDWTENPQASAPKQSDLSLFYSKGYPDLVKYIRNQPFSGQPGKKWNYASINAILSMAVVKKVSGNKAGDAPWDLLFGPLGMDSVRMERDRRGVYNGGAHVHMAAQDLVKLGQLYANDGVVNGKRILPEGWVSGVASQPVSSKAMSAKDLELFGQSGPYSQGGLWLNQPIVGAKKKTRPYPNLPANLLEASGAFGQKLLILPDQGLVIARTAHDDSDFEYPVNEVVANALRCFAPGDPATPKDAIQATAPQSKDFDLGSAFEQIGDLRSITDSGAFSGMIAKELCSCRYIAGLGVDDCLDRSPIPKAVAHALFDIEPEDNSRVVKVSARFSNRPAQASFNRKAPREGCQMSYGAADYRGVQ